MSPATGAIHRFILTISLYISAYGFTVAKTYEELSKMSWKDCEFLWLIGFQIQLDEDFVEFGHAEGFGQEGIRAAFHSHPAELLREKPAYHHEWNRIPF